VIETNPTDSTTQTTSTRSKHTLDKNHFLFAMTKRGWTYSDSHGWLAPTGRHTRATMEQDWIDSILESVDCPHEPERKESLENA
jgi:hypothetical protein